MKLPVRRVPVNLEDLPNIGRNIAADLRKIGIRCPAELQERKPLEVFRKLERVMGSRHDPCVLYTLLSVEHYFAKGEIVPWWKFTKSGKEILESQRRGS